MKKKSRLGSDGAGQNLAAQGFDMKNKPVAMSSSSASAALPAGTVKRLMITKMVMENFKSYGGRKEIGPFHKVRPRVFKI